MTWRAPDSGPEVAGYYIYMREASSQSFTRVDAGDTTSHKVQDLIQGKTYTFYVTAFNAQGLESDPSNTFTYAVPVAPPPPPPPPPTGFELTAEPVSQYGLLLTWESVEGTSYIIWGKDSFDERYWTPVSDTLFITAIGPYTSFLVPKTPVGRGFYLVEKFGVMPPN